MTRRPSNADEDFALRLRARGVETTPERVQAFREIGLLPAPTRYYPGGGGSVGRYPPATIDRMREALSLADKYPRALYLAVAAMFVRDNYPVAEAKLRRALLRVLKRMRLDLHRAAGNDASEVEAALRAGETLAARVMRDPAYGPMRRNIKREKGRKREDVVVDVMTSQVETLLTGALPAPDLLVRIGEYLGLARLLGHDVLGAVVALATPDDTAHLKLDHVEAALKEATMTEFDQARIEAEACNHCMKSMQRLVHLFSGQPVGPPAPIARDDEELVAYVIANVAQRRLRTTTYETTMPIALRLSALLHLLDLLPAETHCVYVAQTEPFALAPKQQESHDALRRQFAVEFPEQSRLLPYHPE